MDIPKSKMSTSKSSENMNRPSPSANDPLSSSLGASSLGAAGKRGKGKARPGASAEKSNHSSHAGTPVDVGTPRSADGGADTPEPRDVDDLWERPPGSEPFQDADFCCEDEGATGLCEQVMRYATMSNPHRSGNPLVWVSRGFEQMTGFTEEESLGRNCSFLQGAETEETSVSELRKGMEELRATQVDITNYKKDGTAFVNSLGVYPVLDGEGAVFRFMGLQVNLTDRQKARADKGEGGEDVRLGRMREMAERVMGSYCVVDASQPTQPILWCSEGFSEMTGYSSDDLAGLSVLCLQGPDSQWGTMQEVNSAIHNRRRGVCKLILHKQDGSPFQAYVSIVPACERLNTGRGPVHMLVQMCDVTARRRQHVGHYLLGRVVGKGASGVVRIARKDRGDRDRDRDPGESSDGRNDLVAVKAIDTTKFKSIAEIDSVQAEMAILERLKHDNVVRMLDVMYMHDHIYIVMEYASGGSLMRRIYHNRLKRLEEPEAWRLFDQIVSALNYCHRRLIVHRDLKPENLLLDGAGNIKIADFGLSAIVSPFMQGLSTTVGTPEFTAPEIINGDEYNGEAVDIWSLGVILYEFVSGSLPFQAPDMDQLFEVVVAGKFTCPPHMSEDCEDLIRAMLHVNPRKRSPLSDIMAHPWYRRFAREAEREGRDGDDDMGGLSDDEGDPLREKRSSSPDPIHSSARLQLPAEFMMSLNKEADAAGLGTPPNDDKGKGARKGNKSNPGSMERAEPVPRQKNMSMETTGRHGGRAGAAGRAHSKEVTGTPPRRGGISKEQPTLNPGAQGYSSDDRVLEDRWSIRMYRFNRGEVVMLRAPDDPKSCIVKRLIALEGDWVNVDNDILRVPKGHCWVEGDNRKLSTDSRSAYGAVPMALIEGRVTHVLWPPSRWGAVERFEPHGRVILQRKSVENL